MRILKIWDADYPWDIRVEKICNSLIEEGHEVHLLCRNLRKMNRVDMINGIKINRLPCIPTRILNYFLSFPFFLNPIWGLTAISIVYKNNIEIILVRDLPLAPLAIIIGKLFRIKVIFDMAENYPAMLLNQWKTKKKNPINFFVRNPRFATVLEKIVCRLCDKIIVVIEESKDRLNEFIDNNNIVIVRNTPSLKHLDSEPEILNNHAFKMVYIGGLQKGRGVDKVLEVVPDIIKKIPNFEFVICGSGYEFENLKRMAVQYKIKDFVNFLGWIDNKKIFEIISRCHVGIIPHMKTPHTDTTIPNKLFDYMIMGKPVIATNCRPIERILKKDMCGMTFNANDFSELPEVLTQLNNPYSLKKLGSNAIKAVKENYNWDLDAQRLKQIFIQLKR